MTEQQVQKKILDYLTSIGAWSCKTISTNKRGVPDILACLDGKFIGIEVKAPGKLYNLSPLQKHQIDAINSTGGIAFAADSVETVKNILDIEQNTI